MNIINITDTYDTININHVNISEWKNVSFDDRNYNDGWAQPVNWLNFSFGADLLIKFFNLNIYK